MRDKISIQLVEAELGSVDAKFSASMSWPLQLLVLTGGLGVSEQLAGEWSPS